VDRYLLAACNVVQYFNLCIDASCWACLLSACSKLYTVTYARGCDCVYLHIETHKLYIYIYIYKYIKGCDCVYLHIETHRL
jgi:hypothetical protein